jgi:hypothetical protein
MDNIKKYQRAVQQLAARSLGLNSYWSRVFVVSTKGLGEETDGIRHPVTPNMASVQTPDGKRVFMAGFSAAGGDDPAG